MVAIKGGLAISSRLWFEVMFLTEQNKLFNSVEDITFSPKVKWERTRIEKDKLMLRKMIFTLVKWHGF